MISERNNSDQKSVTKNNSSNGSERGEIDLLIKDGMIVESNIQQIVHINSSMLNTTQSEINFDSSIEFQRKFQSSTQDQFDFRQETT